MVIAANLDDPARLTDLAASNLDLKLEEAQQILETIDPVERLKRMTGLCRPTLFFCTAKSNTLPEEAGLEKNKIIDYGAAAFHDAIDKWEKFIGVDTCSSAGILEKKPPFFVQGRECAPGSSPIIQSRNVIPPLSKNKFSVNSVLH